MTLGDVSEHAHNFGDFIGRHWGDFVALTILVGGAILALVYASKSGDWSEVKLLAQTLTGAALFGLKLRSNPKENGKNGNTNGTGTQV